MRIVFLFIACTFSSLVAAQETRDVCPQAIPPGWVVAGSHPCADCCGPGTSRKLTIRHIDDAPTGTRVDMCPGETPRGWAVVSSRPCADCCGSGMTQMLTIERIGNDSAGNDSAGNDARGAHHDREARHDDEEHRGWHTPFNPNPAQMDICAGQAIPYGWVIVSSRMCSNCCGLSMSQMFTIKRVGQ